MRYHHCSACPPFGGFCDDCRMQALKDVRLRASAFAGHAIRYMTQVEKQHLTTMFYSDEAEKSNVDVVRAGAQHGMATGFLAASRKFTKRVGVSSSQAVRAFIGGGYTVCECEGAVHAVILNALVDICGPDVFDLTFPELLLGSDESVTRDLFTKVKAPDEKNIRTGDWVYIHTYASRDLQESCMGSRRGAAGGGWNLICVAPGQFLGFGLNEGDAIGSFTLNEIRDKIAGEATADNAEKAESSLGFGSEKRRQRVLTPGSSSSSGQGTFRTRCDVVGTATIARPTHQRRGSGGYEVAERPALNHNHILGDMLVGPKEIMSRKRNIKESIRVSWYRRFNVDKLLAKVDRAMPLKFTIRKKGG